MNGLPEKITDILERITDAFVALDNNWRYTYMNKKAGQIFNRDPAKMTGKHIWTEFPEGVGQPFHLAYEKAMKEQQYVYLEEYYAPYGLWFENHIYPSPEGLSIYFRDITEKKKQEIKLKENEEKYRSLIEQAGDAILIYSLDGTIYEFNDRACTLSGYTREEFARLKLTDILVGDIILHPDRYEMIMKGDAVTLYRQFRKKNGEVIEMEITAKILSDGKFFGMARDITERKNAEDKIRESEMKYRTLMQQAGDYILLFSGTGRLLEANQSARQLLGYSIEEYKKMSLKDLFFEEDIKQNPFQFDLLNKGESTINRRRLKRKDGTAVETEIHAKKLSDGTYLGVARDLTERIKSIEQLRESEEKYHTLVEHASDGIVIVGINGTCIDANSTICNMLGYSKEELNNRNLFELVIINKGDVPFRIAEVLAGKSVLQERNIIKKDGSILSVELNSKLLPDKRILVIVRDITERRQIEDALRRSNERNDIVAKATSDVIWDWDLVTGKVYRSPEGLKKVYGYDDNAPIEIVTEWSKQVHPDDKEMMDMLIDKIHHSPDQNTFSVEYRFLRQDDGKYVNVFDRGYIIRDEHGKPVRMIGAAQDITERKKAEEKILKSEEQYRDLIDNITDLICTHDLNGRILSANRAAEKLIGFKLNPQENLNIREILTADTKNNFDLYLTEVKTKGHAQGLMKVQTKTGEIRIWEYNNSLKTTGVEAPVVRGYARDITERKKAEDLVKKQKKQYDELVKNIPVGVYKFRMKPDGSMSFDYISPRLCEMIGIKEEDAYRDIMNAFRVIHPDDFGRFIQSIKESFITKQNFLWEGRGNIAGHLKWMKIESSPRVLENGDILWDGVMADMTGYKKAEDALRESEETFRRLFNESADAVLLLDDTGFSDCNQSAVAIFGCSSKEQILNKKPWDISPERQPDGRLSIEKAKAMIEHALQQGYNRFEWVHIKSDGTEFPVEVMLTSIILNGKQSYYSLLRDITERKKTEEKIRINEARLTKAQQIGKLGYWQQDLNSNMIWGSEEARKIYGFPPVAGELAEETVSACIPDFEMVRQAAIDLLKHNKKYDIEFQINPADGSPAKYISALAEIEKDNQGVPVRIMGVLKDITEYKKGEQELQKAIERYELIGKATNDALWEWNLQTKEIWGNESFYQLYGLERGKDSLGNLQFYSRTHPEDVPKLQSVLADAYEQKAQSLVMEFRFRMPDDSYKTFLDRAFIYYNDNGKPARLIGAMQDITERKKAELELRTEKDRFEKIVNTVPGVIYTVKLRPDGSSRYPYSSPGMFEMFGLNTEELKEDSSPLLQRIHPDDIEKTMKAIFASAQNMTEIRVEFRFEHPQKGWIWIEANSLPSANPDGSIVWTGFVSDITERKKSEEQIKSSNEQLRQLTTHLQNIREEERKRIGREIHDELGQQLTAIKMDVAWINKKIPDLSSGTDKVSLIKSKLQNIIALLDGSNISVRKILSELRPALLDDHGLLEALEWQGRQFMEATGIPVKFITAETELRLDQETTNCIFRIYQESLTNIMRYAKAKKVLTSLNIAGENILLSVEDDGKGFDTEKVRDKNKFGILGIRERVLSLGGKFELISEKGKGTKISISLPYKA